MRERNALVVFGLTFIDLLVISDTKYSFIDLEEKLGLCSVVDSNTWPFGLTVFIIYEGTGKYTFELLTYRRTFNHFSQT